jgi:hypothetical protein
MDPSWSVFSASRCCFSRYIPSYGLTSLMRVLPETRKTVLHRDYTGIVPHSVFSNRPQQRNKGSAIRSLSVIAPAFIVRIELECRCSWRHPTWSLLGLGLASLSKAPRANSPVHLRKPFPLAPGSHPGASQLASAAPLTNCGRLVHAAAEYRYIPLGAQGGLLTREAFAAHQTDLKQNLIALKQASAAALIEDHTCTLCTGTKSSRYGSISSFLVLPSTVPGTVPGLHQQLPNCPRWEPGRHSANLTVEKHQASIIALFTPASASSYLIYNLDNRHLTRRTLHQ